MPNRPYIVGNWKMNGTRPMLAEARAIDRAAARFPKVRVALAPPFTLIREMREAVQDIGVGAQDCHAEVSGAFTGDVSAPMLADAGADFAIVGHSERRAMHGETDAVVRAKAEAALAAGLTVILWKQGHGGIFELYEMVPGVLLSTLAIWVVSRLGRSE